MTWSAKSTRQRMERKHAPRQRRSVPLNGSRAHAPGRLHKTKGFPALVMTLAALTFFGVYGLMSPDKVGAPAAPLSFASDISWRGDSSSSAAQLTSTYYSNCDAARAAGAAPVRRGEPGYASHLDRDNDGVGCESY